MWGCVGMPVVSSVGGWDRVVAAIVLGATKQMGCGFTLEDSR